MIEHMYIPSLQQLQQLAMATTSYRRPSPLLPIIPRNVRRSNVKQSCCTYVICAQLPRSRLSIAHCDLAVLAPQTPRSVPFILSDRQQQCDSGSGRDLKSDQFFTDHFARSIICCIGAGIHSILHVLRRHAYISRDRSRAICMNLVRSSQIGIFAHIRMRCESMHHVALD